MKAFLVGLGLGTLVGVAYAPRSGRETRRELQDRARQSVEGASDKLNAMREQLGSARSRVQSAAQEVKRSVRSFGDQETTDPRNEAQADFGSTQKAAGRNDLQKFGSNPPSTDIAIGGDAEGEASHSESSGPVSFLEVINEWPEERLIAIHGIGPVLASKIIKNRPYEQESDLVDSKELPPSAIQALRKAS